MIFYECRGVSRKRGNLSFPQASIHNLVLYILKRWSSPTMRQVSLNLLHLRNSHSSTLIGTVAICTKLSNQNAASPLFKSNLEYTMYVTMHVCRLRLLWLAEAETVTRESRNSHSNSALLPSATSRKRRNLSKRWSQAGSLIPCLVQLLKLPNLL